MSMHSTNIEPMIAGAGIDASPSRRPGVPMELEPPRPVGAAHWAEPERQPNPGNILRRKGLARLTPVFGTAAPPRGFSGLMRRAAYRLPEHHVTHWLMLLLADRVDAFEHRAYRAMPFVLPVVAGTVAVLAVSRARRRRSRWFA